MHKKNAFISLFASVQLAILLLFILASTSIIGTIIPQNNVPGFYVERYGEQTARFFLLLHIDDMYNSWWFLGLLGLFALNLTVCSLDRIPQVLRILRGDRLAITPEQLKKMPMYTTITLDAAPERAIEQVTALFTRHHWRPRTIDKDGGRLFAAEKGGWSRFGVYVVHCSILIILAGAMIGSSTVADTILHQPGFAFKGSIMIPEGHTIRHITTFKRSAHIDLGFQLRCDDFAIEHYPNGMPKTYRAKVSILEGGQVVRQTDIEVNRPLTHRGITFYQSSYQPFQQYRVILQRRADGLETSDIIAAAQEINWPQAGISYGIINRENQGEVTRRLKIWFSDHHGEPAIFWLDAGQETVIERSGNTYRLTMEQVYATGLQATKDPGVGLVYGGCFLMLAGLYVAFFLSHRRLYAFVRQDGHQCHLVFAGESNKNKVGFEHKFNKFIHTLGTYT